MTRGYKNKGWPYEPTRHGLASQGIKTTKKKSAYAHSESESELVEGYKDEIEAQIKTEIKPIAEKMKELGLSGTIYFNASSLVASDEAEDTDDLAYEIAMEIYHGDDDIELQHPHSSYSEEYDEHSDIMEYNFEYTVGTSKSSEIGAIPEGESEERVTKEKLKKIEETMEENQGDTYPTMIYVRGKDGDREGLVNNIDGGVELL